MKKKHLMVIFILSVCLLALGNSISAKENKSDTDVSMDITQADQYTLKVNVEGPGAILDGNQQIREGSITYRIGLDRTKEFKIKPDNNSIVKSVIYERPVLNDKRDITKEIKDNKIAIDIESTEMILTVIFETENKNEQSLDKKPPKVDTGDITKRVVYVVGISISLCSMFLIIQHKKKKKQGQ